MTAAVQMSEENLSLDKQICFLSRGVVHELNNNRQPVCLGFSLIVWKIFKLILTHYFLYSRILLSFSYGNVDHNYEVWPSLL